MQFWRHCRCCLALECCFMSAARCALANDCCAPDFFSAADASKLSGLQ
jgi:hypothetical protein